MKSRINFRSQHGQTMTEFALVLPLLVILLFGVIQFGIAFNNYITLTDAVRAGARKGAVSRHATSPSAAVVDTVKRAATDLKPADLQVAVVSNWTHGSDVKVTGTYPYSISLMGVVVKSGRLSASATERVE